MMRMIMDGVDGAEGQYYDNAAAIVDDGRGHDDKDGDDDKDEETMMTMMLAGE